MIVYLFEQIHTLINIYLMKNILFLIKYIIYFAIINNYSFFINYDL